MAVIKSTSIELKSGMLLSKEILEQMDFQSQLFQMQYDSYPDGIIYGFEVYERDDILYISSGLIKYLGRYYFSHDEINIFELLDDFDRKCTSDFTEYCALVFIPCEKENINEGIISECLELKLCREDILDPGYIIIAEFQYHYKKREWKPENVSAAEKLENQLNRNGYDYTFLNVKYSISNESVFSPYIYSMMKECLKEKKDKSPADIMLLFMLCQSQLLSFSVLKEWFEFYGFKFYDDRKDIIKNFLGCINTENVEKKSYRRDFEMPKQPSTKRKPFGY